MDFFDFDRVRFPRRLARRGDRGRWRLVDDTAARARDGCCSRHRRRHGSLVRVHHEGRRCLGARAAPEHRMEHLRLLAAGSLPAAAITLLVLKSLSVDAKHYGELITKTLAVALVFTSMALIFKDRLHAFALRRSSGVPPDASRLRVATIVTGVAVGTLVTISSVGAGCARRRPRCCSSIRARRDTNRRHRHRARGATHARRRAWAPRARRCRLESARRAADRLVARRVHRQRGEPAHVGAHSAHSARHGAAARRGTSVELEAARRHVGAISRSRIFSYHRARRVRVLSRILRSAVSIDFRSFAVSPLRGNRVDRSRVRQRTYFQSTSPSR